MTTPADRSADADGPGQAIAAARSEVMDAYDIPPDPPHAVRPIAELRRLTNSATTWRLSSQYAKLAALLPGLITHLTAAALNSAGHEQEPATGDDEHLRRRRAVLHRAGAGTHSR